MRRALPQLTVAALALLLAGATPGAEIVMQIPPAPSLLEIAVSRDGSRFAACGESGDVNIYEASTGKLLRSLAPSAGSAYGVDFDLDGEAVFVTWRSGTVAKFEIATGRLIWERRLGPFHGAEAVLSPDGSLLAIGCDPVPNNIHLLDPSNGSTVRVCEGPGASILAIAFNGDGTLLAAGCWYDERCWILHVADGSLHSEFSMKGAERCMGMAFSPDGKTLVATFGEAGAAVRDLEEGSTRPIEGLAHASFSLAFDPSGERLLIGVRGVLKIYSTENWGPLPEFGNSRPFGYDIKPLPDGDYIVGRQSAEIERWSPEGEPRYAIASGARKRVKRFAALDADTDGQTLYALTIEGELWSWGERGATLNFHQQREGQPKLTSFSVAPSGEGLVAGGEDQLVLLDPRSGEPQLVVGQVAAVLDVCFSADGSRFAAAHNRQDGPAVGIWSADGEELAASTTLSENAEVVVLENSGKRAFISTEKSILRWDVEAGEVRPFAEVPGGHLLDLSPDGTRLAALGRHLNACLRIWDTGSGALLVDKNWRADGHTTYQFGYWGQELPEDAWGNDGYTSFAFTSDGSRLAGGRKFGGISLWSAETGNLRRNHFVNGAWFSHITTAGGWVAAAYSPGTVRIWDLSSGELEQELRILPGDEWLSHSPDRLYFNGSEGALAMAAIRFGEGFDQIYPLSDYRDELQKPAAIPDRRVAAVSISPKKLSHWWANLPNKRGVITGMAVILGLALVVAALRRRIRERALQRQQNFARRMIEAREADRQKIAAEIHDSLGQNLLILKTQTDLARKALPEDSGAQEKLRTISAQTAETIEEARSLAYDLRPYQLDRLGLTLALRGMVSKLSENVPFDIEQDIGEVDELLKRDDEISVFRFVQECLNNVIKHAGASAASVFVDLVSGAMKIEIKDDGIGFNPPEAKTGGGLGLQNLSDHARLLNGEFDLVSTPGVGTRLTITVPVQNG